MLKSIRRRITDGEGAAESDVRNLQGNMIDAPLDDKLTDDHSERDTMGTTASPYSCRKKKRVLYKECKIAGTYFRDLEDVWDELYEGAELSLIREKNNKHDRLAIAVALAADYDGDPDEFDFNFILGYVPRAENEHLANMMDMGWADAFECELSRKQGSGPSHGSLFMRIYIVSRDGNTLLNTDNLLRAWILDDETFREFTHNLETQGCDYFRWGGFPYDDHNLPEKGDKVVFVTDEENAKRLYLMYCMAVGADAAYFVEDKDSLTFTDDCCYYVFTLIKGPVLVQDKELKFLEEERISEVQPEEFLSEEASLKLIQIFNNYDSHYPSK